MRFLSLDLKGLLLSLLIGMLVLVLGGGNGVFLLSILVFFLVLSAMATEIGKKRKRQMRVYEKVRGWKNVAANGLVPLLIVFVLFLDTHLGYNNTGVLVLAYVSSVSAITSDKFASEIGILGGLPRDIFTFKRLERGLSGGITLLGLGAAFVAAFVVSSGLIIQRYPVNIVLLSGSSGFLGNIVDSIFGHFEERGFGNKYSSNLICGLFGALFSLLIIAIV